ncbi:MAG: hypothetical protein RIT45_511 [Pseudomonadota bacterium]
MATRRARWPWMLAAVLLATGAVLIGLLDRDEVEIEVVYPRDRADEGGEPGEPHVTVEVEREGGEPNPEAPPDAKLRLPGTLPSLGHAATRSGREALRRAVSPPGSGHMLIDVAALQRSDLARKMLRCRGDRMRAGLERLHAATGIDLQRDVETIGFGRDAIAVGGRLGNLRLPPELGDGERYGDGARLFELSGSARNHVAIVGDHTAVIAETADALRAAVDRIEGRAAAEVAAAGHADIEGVLLPDDLAPLFGRRPDAGDGDRDELSQLLDEAGTLMHQLAFRVNVDEQAAMSFDLGAASDAEAERLGKVSRSALTLLRQAARHEGARRMEQLLDQARVLPASGQKLGLDLAVPDQWILERMGCDAEGNRIEPEPAPAAAESEAAPNLDHPSE